MQMKFKHCMLSLDESIAYNGEYEISNATVKPVDNQYRTVNDHLPYQLNFNHRTVVRLVCPETGYVGPQYQSIASIPKLEIADGRYDVLGVILFVEEAARQVTSIYNTQGYVREIIIADQIHNQPSTISTWNDLSGTASDALNFWAERFSVVGFTTLKQNPRRAFALSTTMSTRIIHDPKGDRANMLRECSDTLYLYKVVAQKQLLQDKQSRVLQIRDYTQQQSMKKIEELKEKKAANALMEEKHWIQAIIPSAALENVFVYTSCSSCGRKCSYPEGRQFTCIVYDNKNCISSPSAETVDTSKISTAEWTELCRTRMSGTKHSPVTPAPVGDTKSSLDCAQGTVAKKLRFTAAEHNVNEGDEPAKKGAP
uniref:Uncharacterized protein n=1 Tax=Chenopodium quinoa TaxID=63459 RepID=A0A803MLQ3_CHEQI